MLLSDAIRHAEARWKDRRKARSNTCWASAMARALGPSTNLDDITYDTLCLYRDTMGHLSPATIYARMSVASVVFDEAARHGWRGTKPVIPYPHVPRPRKWWLNPQQQEELLLWLHQQTTDETGWKKRYNTPSCTAGDLADYIKWATLTGLRVEETLRVEIGHLFLTPQSTACLTVPGTKTRGSEATIPIPAAAYEIARARHPSPSAPSALLFRMTYRTLYRRWLWAVRSMGWPPGAQLKALRRTFARTHASAPLPVLQQLMRHRTPATTLEYLRLTGGQFSVEEMAQWVK